MNTVNPFRQDGRWYRGNTHAHSSVSDGVFSVAECFEGYRSHGYDFLVLTDHGEVSDVSRFTDESFLAISGSELHPTNPYGGNLYHIVAINLPRKVKSSDRHPNEVMEEVRELGGICVLAHPYWSGHTVQDLLPLHGYCAVEVFNTTCEKNGRSTSESQWDDLLDKTTLVLGIAADDCHFRHDVYQGWVMVKSPALDAASITRSLASGSFYSTQGPEILDFDIVEPTARAGAGLRVQARFSAAASVVFKAANSRGKSIRSQDGSPLTEAVYDVAGDEKYVRLELTAPDGRKAWSQPIDLRVAAAGGQR